MTALKKTEFVFTISAWGYFASGIVMIHFTVLRGFCELQRSNVSIECYNYYMLAVVCWMSIEHSRYQVRTDLYVGHKIMLKKIYLISALENKQ